MRIKRLHLGLLAAALLPAAALAPAAFGSPQETIWAECVSGSAAQTCQEASWYTSPVEVVWRASPAPEGTSPCLLGIEYAYESDGVSALSCEAHWKEGGTDKRKFVLHTEVSPLATEAVPERPPDSNGWYNHPVSLMFKGHGFSGPATCYANGGSANSSYSGPDTVGATVAAKCVDPAGKSATPSFTLRYDSTPPTITNAFPDRAPDFNGWFNRPVTFVFTGTDPVSGMEPCSATYAGPDNESAELLGVCHDGAGNVASLAISFRYRATPPPLKASAAPGDGLVSLHWRSSTSVEVLRSPGLNGPHSSLLYKGMRSSFVDTRSRDGVRYTYLLRAKDVAGNVTQHSFTVTPGPRLLAPTANARVSAPPLLRWTAVRGASFYNVQLFRGQKLLSVWPALAKLQLTRAWRFGGNEYHLSAGRYTWYVWPGFGSLSAPRYGPLIGHRTFVIE